MFAAAGLIFGSCARPRDPVEFRGLGAEKQKALVVATRCTSVEQFVTTFHRFCDQWSFFVATMASRPVGLETAFSIQLEDKTPVLRGLCTVVEAWATPANRFGRPGVRLEVKRLTKESVPVFEALQNARKAAEAAPVPAPPARPSQAAVEPPAARSDTSAAPEPVSNDVDLTNPVATETRTPGSSYVLPANPLMNLTDASLEGFVDCALYEETANFFRAPEDESSLVDLGDAIAEPPPPERRSSRTLNPVSALRPTAFLRPDDDFVPEHTPLPQLAGFVPARAATPPPVPSTPPAGPAPAPPPIESGAPMFGPPGAYVPAATATSPMRSPVDSTENLLAIAQRRDRKKWLMIGGAAAGGSLLLLVIVLAIRGGGDDKTADAATQPMKEPAETETASSDPPKADPPKADPTKVAKADPPKVAKVDPASSGTPAVESVDEPPPTGDPNAPPVVGSGPCTVTVTSSPAGSMVSIDDQQVGPSPITVAGPCAKRKVDVKHPRYALGTKWVTLSQGTPGTVDLMLARPTHNVMVTSLPPGATVSIAGRRAGTTPTQVKVMGFTGVTITVEKKGYKTVSQKLYSKLDNDSIKVILVRGR